MSIIAFSRSSEGVKKNFNIEWIFRYKVAKAGTNLNS